MTQSLITKRNTISVYGCGGTGINILQDYTNLPVDDPEKPFFAIPSYHAIDTSGSNLRNLQHINSTILPGLSGAGKDRSKPFTDAKLAVDNMLNDHKPGDINVIIFSLSGGSGSIIGPLITSAILRRNKPVVCIVVASTTSAKEADNSIKTFQTLQNMASISTGDKPIPMIYFENSDNPTAEYMGSRRDIDARIETVIRQLALLYSGNHKELDKTDLENWLNYRKISPDVKPQLVEIMIYKEGGEVNSLHNRVSYSEELEAHTGTCIATASLLRNDSDPVPAINQAYSAVGYYNDQILEKSDMPNHHYILTASRIPYIYRGLEDALQRFREAKQTIMGAEIVGTNMPTDDDTGMVL